MCVTNTYTMQSKKKKGSEKTSGVLLFLCFSQKADLLFKKKRRALRNGAGEVPPWQKAPMLMLRLLNFDLSVPEATEQLRDALLAFTEGLTPFSLTRPHPGSPP